MENRSAKGDVRFSGCLHRTWRSPSDGRCTNSCYGLPVFDWALWLWKISPDTYLQGWPQVSIMGAQIIMVAFLHENSISEQYWASWVGNYWSLVNKGTDPRKDLYSSSAHDLTYCLITVHMIAAKRKTLLQHHFLLLSTSPWIDSYSCVHLSDDLQCALCFIQ